MSAVTENLSCSTLGAEVRLPGRRRIGPAACLARPASTSSCSPRAVGRRGRQLLPEGAERSTTAGATLIILAAAATVAHTFPVKSPRAT